jgi:C-terminal processing protease CtpA/Prc
MTYWQREADLDPHDLDQVGITLETRDNVKGYFVAAIVTTTNGKPAVQNVRVGDKLIQVDGVVMSDATRGAIFSALHGKPGSTRTLLLDRDGKQMRVPVSTRAF